MPAPSHYLAVRKQHAAQLMVLLKAAYPNVRCSLDHANPLELLVATVLSAQCTDERVNQVTPALFAKYPHARDYARADLETLEREIHSTGFFRNKAKALKGLGDILERVHYGKVPADMDALTQLPGVGRKTANVILGNAFGINEGVVVDTHVQRLSQRLGLSDHKQPEKIERNLMEVFPQEEWTNVSHLLILHGRNVCAARKPLCEQCVLARYCPRIGVG